MRTLLVLVVFVLGCGEHRPPRSVPVPAISGSAVEVAVSADAVAPAEDAGVIVRSHCWVGESWVCASAPPAGNRSGTSAGGCCQGNHWTCGRLPRRDECPGAGGVREP